MKQLNGYAKAQAYTEAEKLPIGGYIIGILDVTEQEMSNGSNCLVFKYDIAEGDYKNFYYNQYKNNQNEDKKYKGVYRLFVPKDDGSEQDGWAQNRFKTHIQAIEDSNPEFHWSWDETQLKNKKVGAIFFDKEWEYNGKTGFATTLHSFHSIDDIKNKKIKQPPAKMLANKKGSIDVVKEDDDFKTIASDDGDLPF